MFDLFGVGKEMQMKDIFESISKGMTIGLLDVYEMRLMDKDREIEKLNTKIQELNNKIEELENAENKTQGDSE